MTTNRLWVDEREQAVLREEAVDGVDTLLPGEREIYEQWAGAAFGSDVSLLAYRADASWIYVELLGPADTTESGGRWQPILATGGGRTLHEAADAAERAYLAEERSPSRRARAGLFRPFCISQDEVERIRAFVALDGDPEEQCPEQFVMSGTWQVETEGA